MKLINFLVTLVISMLLATPLTAHITGCTVLEHPATGKRFVLIYRTINVSEERFSCGTPIETIDSHALADWLINRLAYASQKTHILCACSKLAIMNVQSAHKGFVTSSVDSQLTLMTDKKITLGNVSFPINEASLLSAYFDLDNVFMHLFNEFKAGAATLSNLAGAALARKKEEIEAIVLGNNLSLFTEHMITPSIQKGAASITVGKIVDKIDALLAFIHAHQKTDHLFKTEYAESAAILKELKDLFGSVDSASRSQPFSFFMAQKLHSLVRGNTDNPVGACYRSLGVLSGHVASGFAQFYIPYIVSMYPDQHLVGITVAASYEYDSAGPIMIKHLQRLGYSVIAGGNRQLPPPILAESGLLRGSADGRRAQVYAMLADSVPLQIARCSLCNPKAVAAPAAEALASEFSTTTRTRPLTKTLLYYLHEAYKNTACDVTNPAWNDAPLIIEALASLSKAEQVMLTKELGSLGLKFNELNGFFRIINSFKTRMLEPSSTTRLAAASAASSIGGVHLASAGALAADVQHAQLVQTDYERLLQATIKGPLKDFIQACLQLDAAEQPTPTHAHCTFGMIFAALETKVTSAQAHNILLYYKAQGTKRKAAASAADGASAGADEETDERSMSAPQDASSTAEAYAAGSYVAAATADDDGEWEEVTPGAPRPTIKVFASNFAGITYRVTLYCAKRLRLLSAAQQAAQADLISTYQPQRFAASAIQQRFFVLNHLPAGLTAAKAASPNDYRVMLPPGSPFAGYDENVTNKIDLYHLMAPELDHYLLGQGIFESTTFDDGSPRLTCNLIVDLTVNPDSAAPQTVRGCMQYGFLRNASSYHHRCFIPLKRCSPFVHDLVTRGVAAGALPVIADDDSATATGAAAITICATCGKAPEKLLTCGGCGLVRYCNAACQKADWKNHKKVCFKK
jgi:hypothetical protein